MNKKVNKPTGKLGILIPGLLGSVSTTFISGIELIRRGYEKPYGSITQMEKIEHNGKNYRVNELIPFAKLKDLIFGGWDILNDNLYNSTKKAKVLNPSDLDKVKNFLKGIRPMKGVFDKNYVNLNGKYIKKTKSKRELANELIGDIKEFKKNNKLNRLVMIWAASTERYIPITEVHKNLENFERGLDKNDKNISPSMIYAYAALKSKIPFVNGAPGLTVDFPAMYELSKKMKVPIAGKDFKTGQTLIKTIVASGLKRRVLGINGWFSTNILGNKDGEVLTDPGSFKTKEKSKLSVLNSILHPEIYPELYKNLYHKVRINYYPPRGDNKESWDNIDIFGWLGYPMQIKINFLCRDSILAAPLMLDLSLFMDFAQRANLIGIQEWLSFYFKSPMTLKSAENDLFVQYENLKGFLNKFFNF